MSAEPPKKRGRPRKVVEIDAQTPSSITKKTVSTRSAAKPISRTKAQSIDGQVNNEMSDMKTKDSGQDSVTPKATRTAKITRSTKTPLKKSTIAEQATAFQEQAMPTASSVSKQRVSGVNDGGIIHESQPNKMSTAYANKSSFLTSFLDEKSSETVPIAGADAVISDRSAFQSSKLSIDDIVSGEGVSNIATFATRQTASKHSRPSVIPIHQPKSFNSHKTQAFEARPKATASPARVFDPAKFATSSFTAFKASPAAQTQHQSHVAKQEHHQHQQIQNQQSEVGDAGRGQATVLPLTARPSLPTKPAEYREPLPPSGIKPISQMERAAIMKSPAYKRKLWQWTRLIVALPFLVVSSYMLVTEYRRSSSGHSISGDMDVDPKRERGYVPLRGAGSS